MSVYPLYLVLGSDGTIGAYAREVYSARRVGETFPRAECEGQRPVG